MLIVFTALAAQTVTPPTPQTDPALTNPNILIVTPGCKAPVLMSHQELQIKTERVSTRSVYSGTRHYVNHKIVPDYHIETTIEKLYSDDEMKVIASGWVETAGMLPADRGGMGYGVQGWLADPTPRMVFENRGKLFLGLDHLLDWSKWTAGYCPKSEIERAWGSGMLGPPGNYTVGHFMVFARVDFVKQPDGSYMTKTTFTLGGRPGDCPALKLFGAQDLLGTTEALGCVGSPADEQERARKR